MDEIVLKPEIVDKIKSINMLACGVADALGISVYSLPRLWKDNDPRLTQANVLKVISDFLKIEDTEALLLTQVKQC